MEIIKIEDSDKEGAFKYLLTDNGNDIGFGYLYARENNPIEIYISPAYQSNGYGKKLFGFLLGEARNLGLKGMFFEVDEQFNRFINIISQAGAVHLGKKNNIIKFMLKL